MARLSLRTALAALAACALLTVAFSTVSASHPEQAVAYGKKVKKALRKNKPVYDRKWKHKVGGKTKKWARQVAECESGRNPNALGGGGRYRGAFQFSSSTWKTSPRSPGGDPVAYSYKTQAFVAVKLMRRDGKGHWPNCG